MHSKKLVAAWIGFVATSALIGAVQAQSSSTLFTVGKQTVSTDEFEYIYRKTNADSADYSRKSLEEYLELYKRFKLKVAEAKAMGLDTQPALRQELAGYRRQLSDSYLVDQQVTEPLARELHDRRQEDVRVFHISVDLPKTGNDTLSAFRNISEARRRVLAGEMWARVAKELSTDPSAARNGGEVGFITAPLPEGLYQLENAVYNVAPGQVSEIVRSEKAYHIVKVVERRPARGEIEAAHIFLRKPLEEDPAYIKGRIDSIYQALKAGADFEKLAMELSQDSRSAPRGGYIGFFGINRYESSFEDAAFALKDGGFSEPVETRVGWHIIRRISSRQQSDWALTRPELMSRVKRMERFDAGRRAMVKRQQKEFGFRQNPMAIDKYIASLPDTFQNYRWRPSPVDDVMLFTFGQDKNVMLSDFTAYLRDNSSKRVRSEGVMSVEEAARSLYDDFVVDQTLLYAENRLDRDNPAFANLMREYEEGILLFEATKVNIWDKAGKDSTGLAEFFDKNRNRYQWEDRVVLDVYSIPLSRQDELFDPIVKYARKHDAKEVLEKFNEKDSSLVSHHERVIERGREAFVDNIEWKRGQHTAPEIDHRAQLLRIAVVKEVLPKGPKKLEEARGYVIADYQDELEKQWVASLAKKYPVVVDGKVFDGLIRNP